MRLEDYKRIRLVQTHHGWVIKLNRYLQSDPYGPIVTKWGYALILPTISSFVDMHKSDIDKTIEIIERKKASKQ